MGMERKDMRYCGVLPMNRRGMVVVSVLELKDVICVRTPAIKGKERRRIKVQKGKKERSKKRKSRKFNL